MIGQRKRKSPASDRRALCFWLRSVCHCAGQGPHLPDTGRVYKHLEGDQGKWFRNIGPHETIKLISELAFGGSFCNFFFRQASHRTVQHHRIEGPSFVSSRHFLPHRRHKSLRIEKSSHPEYFRLRLVYWKFQTFKTKINK